MILSSGAKYNQINFSKNHVSGNARKIGVTVIWWFTFSNNICELQMRQIVIYRNQSYFLGSVKSAKRFARLASLTQSAKNCKRNVQKYFHDILNRVVGTVKEELVSILPHKWVEPVTIPLVY